MTVNRWVLVRLKRTVNQGMSVPFWLKCFSDTVGQNSLRPPSSYNVTPGEDYIAGPVITKIHSQMLVTVDTFDSPVKMMTVF